MDYLIGAVIGAIIMDAMWAWRLGIPQAMYAKLKGETETITTFNEIEIGQRFFDPVSGEFWVKVSNIYAKQDSGGDENGVDMFNWNDEVVV